jgi:Co/Zn/Cd efflux system component
VLGDAFNNLGVIIAAAVIWKTTFPARYYADPAASMGIGLVLILTALNLGKGSFFWLSQVSISLTVVKSGKEDIFCCKVHLSVWTSRMLSMI